MLRLLHERNLEFTAEIIQLFLNDSKTTLGNLGNQQSLKHALPISGKGLKDSPNNILSPSYLELKTSQKLSSVTAAMQNPSEENRTVTSSWLSFLKSKVKGVLRNQHLTLNHREGIIWWTQGLWDKSTQGISASISDHVFAAQLLISARSPGVPHDLGAKIPHPDTSPLSNLWQQTPESRTLILWIYVAEGLIQRLSTLLEYKTSLKKVHPTLPLIQHSAPCWEWSFQHQLQRWRTPSKSMCPFLTYVDHFISYPALKNSQGD